MHNLPGLLLQLPFFNNHCLKEVVWDGRVGWGRADGSSTPFKVHCTHRLVSHIKYLQPQGTSQWLFALRTLFIVGVNWQDLPRCITFSLTCFFPEDPRLGGQPHRRQQNNLLSTALIICMAFHNNKRKNLDPTACQYLRH